MTVSPAYKPTESADSGFMLKLNLRLNYNCLFLEQLLSETSAPLCRGRVGQREEEERQKQQENH